jgi:hypothetical protein
MNVAEPPIESDNLDPDELQALLQAQSAHSETEVTFPVNMSHVWTQIGQELICQTCMNQHAILLPIGTYFVGVEQDGTPILEKQF